MAEHETMRDIRAGDVPAAFQLSARAGWNQTEEDWRTLLELASHTCLVIEVNGQLAAQAPQPGHITHEHIIRSATE